MSYATQTLDSDFDSDSFEFPELQQFVDELWITDVLFELKSGKEATAYCCTGGPTSEMELVVAKVYRPLHVRGFRNDAVYQAGRFDAADRRTKLAFQQKSKAGKDIQFSSWIEHEFSTLSTLHTAGADVPKPLTRSDSAVLMEYVGDAEGPAPLLQNARFPRSDAQRLFRQLMRNIELWLALGRIHGDLSPFNILYWQEKLVIIDFPQSVDPEVNPHAFDLLARDIANVCSYFRRLGVNAAPELIANDLWMRHRFGELRTTFEGEQYDVR